MENEILTTTLEHSYITRTVRTTGLVLLVLLPFGIIYVGLYDALAFFSAGVWSIINLLFLSALIGVAVRPGGVDKTAVAVLALVKFPLLYASLYCLFRVDIFRVAPLALGMSMVLIVITLKAVARVLFHLDAAPREGRA